jgi:hypothetical protein
MAGSQLLAVAVGATLALLAQVVVQLVIVPRVEARKRREDRWERDVLALGELLTVDLPDRRRAARSDVWFMQNVSQDPDMSVREEYSQFRSKVHEDARASMTAYEAVASTRVEWLVDRITALDPEEPRLKNFRMSGIRFKVAVGGVGLWDYPNEKFTEEAFDEAWNREARFTAELTSAVKELAGLPHPPRRVGTGRLKQVSRWLSATFGM